MLEVYNNNSQSVNVGSNVNFGSIKFETGCTAVFENGDILLQKPGFYFVSINGVMGGTSNIELSLINKKTGLTESGGKTSIGGLTATTTNTFPFSFEVLVQVSPSCCMVDNNKQLVLTNTGSGVINLSRVNIIVTKIA
jgi:hypothetical protein